MQKTGTDILKTKQHFEMLDGMRGIAALSIVVFHFMEWVYADPSNNFIGHGFLAVDFFFCLSGFVIAYSYDDRIGKMGIAAFFKSRIIRLHPLVLLGSILGLLAFLFDPFGGHPEVYSAGKIALIFLASIFVIPFPVMAERSFNLFGLNAPCWSLFWEYVANILYAFILHKLSRRILLMLTLLAATTLCFVSYRAGSLLGGWAGENFWDGGARISFSFLAGMLVYRSNWIIKSKLAFVAMTALLLLSFLMPRSKWDWLVEPIIVLFYFPFLIALGAGVQLTQKLKKLCTFFGKMSYPLYMTHYAAIWMFGNYFTSHKVSSMQLFYIVTIGTIVLVGFAYLVMKIYDMPVRKWLNEKR